MEKFVQLKNFTLKELTVKTAYIQRNPFIVTTEGHAVFSRNSTPEQCCIINYSVVMDDILRIGSIETYDLRLSYADLTDLLITIEQQLIRQGVPTELERTPSEYEVDS